MKKILFILFSFVLMVNCASQEKTTKDKDVSEIKPEKNDEGEWDIDVMDGQYNYYLTAIAQPMSMYSESVLKSRNQSLVSEWNSYFYSGKYRNIIESSITYDPNENYGMNFQYKLYQVFGFVSWKYKLKLNGLSQMDAH